MNQSIVHIALVVRDYDEAIAFFCQKLHFTLVEDSYQPEQDKRWVRVAPPGSNGAQLLLARAATPEQEAFIGNQSGGRVFLFLRTDDFWRDYDDMRSAGINFVREPKEAPYGTVAVFEDLYGNLWDLIQPADGPKPDDGGHTEQTSHAELSSQVLRYEIRIQGHLNVSWSEWFHGLKVTPQENGYTLIAGPIPDQAALHSVLTKILNLGLALLSVRRVG